MSKFGLLNLAVKVLAKESLKNPYKAKKRLPASWFSMFDTSY